MPRLAVVLDTNIYRTLKAPAIAQLTHEARASSAIVCASFWTIMELGAHLADPADPVLRRCHEALQAMWGSCTQYDGASRQLRIVADSDSQLALSLFGRSLPGRLDEVNRYAFILEALAAVPIGTIPASVTPYIEELRRHRDAVESQFADDMRNVVKGIDPNATGWQPFPNDPMKRREELDAVRAGRTMHVLAAALLRRASLAVGIDLTGEADIVGRIQFLLDNFPTPMHFYNGCLCKSIESGIDYSVDKHANSIWDFHLCFYALAGSTTQGIPLALVSNEGGIKAAAVRGGAGDRMFNLAELRDWIHRQ